MKIIHLEKMKNVFVQWCSKGEMKCTDKIRDGGLI